MEMWIWLSMAFPCGFLLLRPSYCLGQLNYQGPGKESAESQEHRLSLGEEPRPKESFIPESASSRSGTQEERHPVSSIGAQELPPPQREKKRFILCTLQKTSLAPMECSHDGELVFKGEKKQKRKTST